MNRCEDVQLLISKYVDAEATPEEREIVDLHVVACVECARKMTEYMEIAAIFAEAPMRAPQPEVRAGLFREIGNVKEEARRKEQMAARRRSWYRWTPPGSARPAASSRARRGFSWGRLWEVASPFAAASMAVCAIIAVVLMNSRPPQSTRPDKQAIANYPDFPAISTIPATVVYPMAANEGDPGVYSQVPPIRTGLASPPPIAATNVPALGTATVEDAALQLEQATHVLEAGETWHQLRDPAYGYMVSYPPNWWTHTRGSTRYFYPWTEGGTAYAPYWINLHVDPNTEGLDAVSGNQALLGGKGRLEGTEGGPLWLRSSGGTEADVTDEIYAFDPNFIYTLRLTVPKESPIAGFEARWSQAQDFFSRMSRNVSLGGQAGRVLFLNGGDLWSVSATEPADPMSVWKGYNSRWTRQFALSPDGRTVAFATTDSSLDLWANELNLAQLDATGSSVAQPSLSGAEIHDIAWYSDRELLALADVEASGLGIYRLALDADGNLAPPELVVALGDEMTGARGLAVSPDRQLITFMAPLGESKSTDIYAVRPDGGNLIKLVGHEAAVSPPRPDGQSVAPQEQAVKSYVWADGKLEPGQGGYTYNLLYTSGNSASPTLYRGGFLHAAPGTSSGPLLDPTWLDRPDAASVQIVHVAYSTSGKVAMSGFYSLRGLKVESLAGLWTADFTGGVLSNVRPLPSPDASLGVADLHWSPDGSAIIYREMVPSSEADFASRYDGRSPFSIVRLDVATGEKTVLYSAPGR
ncbi:MAG: zf-HC2 domain-containing protein [Chloroflexota bacterium]|nr:zf-HC2 domain-containing protein [Chloroflexota bacterium]MDQ5865436.1 zf-HC2 domain-containing protein [Chloroflexota bacterium]